jgi:predicted transposase/invertase (TIGR01784 family)
MGIEEFLLDQAEKKGRQEGRQEGKQEEAIAISREMKADGIPIEQIVKFTKLSIEEIKKIS